MNARVSGTAWKLKWLAPVLALVLLAGVALTAERLLIPQDLTVPLYIRGFDDVKAGWTATGAMLDTSIVAVATLLSAIPSFTLYSKLSLPT